MEDPKWLRLITIGLVLAAVAVGYFLLSSRFTSTPKKNTTQTSQASPVASASPSASPAVLGQNSRGATVSPSPASAYNRIAQRTNGATGAAAGGVQNIQTLPRTGFPIELIASLSASTMLVGWGLRRFPH